LELFMVLLNDLLLESCINLVEDPLLELVRLDVETNVIAKGNLTQTHICFV